MPKEKPQKHSDDEWTKILLDTAKDKLEKPSIIASIVIIILMVILIDLIVRYNS